MAPTAESISKELKHLSPNVCIVAEILTNPSNLWELENVIAENDVKKRTHNSIGNILRNGDEWMFQQDRDEAVYTDLGLYSCPLYVNSNLERLTTKFNNELRNYNNNSSLSLKDITNQFIKSASKISEINFTESVVEITSNESIKYTLVFPEKKMLMISQPFIASNEEEVIYSFFVNRELISTNAMELSAFVEGFKRYLQA